MLATFIQQTCGCQFSCCEEKITNIESITEIQLFLLVHELIYELNVACELDFIIYGGGRKGLRYCGIGSFLVRCCGKFKFYAAVVGEKIVVSRYLLLFHDKRIQILKGLPG